MPKSYRHRLFLGDISAGSGGWGGKSTLDSILRLFSSSHGTGRGPHPIWVNLSAYIPHCHMFISGPKWYLSKGIYILMAGQISRESSRATHRPRGQIFSTLARYIFDQLSSSSELRMLKRWDLTRTMRVLRKVELDFCLETSVFKMVIYSSSVPEFEALFLLGLFKYRTCISLVLVSRPNWTV